MTLSEVMQYVWLIVTVLAAVVEAAVPALVSVWFVPGGLAALIAALCGGPLWLQVTLFLAVSAAALAITRPLYRRMRTKSVENTNADRVLGQTALVTEEIDDLHATGRVEVLGLSWAARTREPGVRIPAGETVTVERIEGVKLVVTPQEKGAHHV